MSFIGAATAMGLTGIGATIGAGVMMGGATTIGMNLIRGNDPFDNIGQGLLLGGISGGIFGGAGAAAGVGEGAAASASFDAAGNMIPIKDMATTAFSDSAAANLGSKYGGTNMLPGMPVSDPYGLTSVANNYNLAPHSIYGGSSSLAVPTPEVYLGDQQFLSDPEAAMQARQLGAMKQTQGLISMPPAPEAVTPATVESPPGTTDMRVNTRNPSGGYTDQFGRSLDATGAPISNGAVAPKTSTTSPTTTSPKFTDDPFGYLTHKDNRGTAMLGGLGLAGAMGALNPKTGLNNLSPRTVSDYETTYNPGTVNPNFGKPGEPYFLKQGYGPGTRVTRNVAAGGGIRALSEGGETAPYVPMTARGQMTNKEDVPTDLDDSAAFKRYLKSDINKDEEKGQAAIDKIVMAWLERHAKSDIKGMAEGGLSNLPAAYQQPQYQMSDFVNSPLFQPTGGNAPVQPGISEYIASLNHRSYTPPAAVAATTPAVTNTTDATVYDPVSQAYIANPNYVAPATVAPATQGAGDAHDNYASGDKAGGPIKAKKFAMGGVTYNPDNQTYSPIPSQAGAYVHNPANMTVDTFTQMLRGDPNKFQDQFFINMLKDHPAWINDAQMPEQYAYDAKEQKYQKYAMGGLAALPEYAAGGKLLSGDGDGMSDDIPAVIKGERPQRAALADGEFVIPADVVSHLGNGSTKAGGQRLYEMMDRVRKARTGNVKQGKQINPMKFMPT